MQTEEIKAVLDADLHKIDMIRERDLKVRKILYWFIAVSCFLNVIAIMVVYLPVHVISYLNDPFPTGKTWYNQGDRLSYTVEYCKSSDSPGTVSRSLVYSDGKTISVQQVAAVAPQGCRTNEVLSFVIPRDAPIGTAHVESTAVYDGIFIRKQVIRTRTRDFTIRARK